MFDPTGHVIDGFLEHLCGRFREAFPHADPVLAEKLDTHGRMALEILARGDAAYHDVEHTVWVTQAGQAILRSKQLHEGGVTAVDALHFLLALLSHDIGYVRGALPWDEPGSYLIGESGERLHPPAGATDACLTEWHVDRGKLLVRQRFVHDPVVDADRICAMIERTRFPVPDLPGYEATGDLPGLARAADLIGQLADPRHTQKQSRLFEEFRETGAAERLGYGDAGALRAHYPEFFWQVASPLMADGVAHLRRTREGRAWIARLHQPVFAEEHALDAEGPERAAQERSIRLIDTRRA
jgi:hypothetical protein